MGSIGKYSYINAKVRAMRSLLLTGSTYRAMTNAGTVAELISILSQTRFQNFLQDLKLEDSDDIEQKLLLQEIRQIQLIQKHAHKDIGHFISNFLERYDAEKLKVLLRYWHRKIRDIPSVIREKIVYDFRVDEILNAERLGEIVVLLAGTPFQKPLSRVADEYRDGKTLFPLELAVDCELFSRLWMGTESLPKADRSIAQRLLGLEIDLKNIDWVSRFRKYYDLSPTEIRRFTLPHGFHLRQEDIDRIASGKEGSNDIVKTTEAMGIPSDMVPENGIQLEDMEYLLYTILLFEARKAFGRFPFSIGSILGYLILLRIETRNIRLLIQAKQYEFTPDQIEPRLVF